jgi:hypothetical protein
MNAQGQTKMWVSHKSNNCCQIPGVKKPMPDISKNTMLTKDWCGKNQGKYEGKLLLASSSVVSMQSHFCFYSIIRPELRTDSTPEL